MKTKLPIKILAMVFVVLTVFSFFTATFASANDAALTANTAKESVGIVAEADVKSIPSVNVNVITATDIEIATATATATSTEAEEVHYFGRCFVVLYHKIVDFFSRIIHLFV